jgi:REP element-mobilizing transposase RayT
MNEDHQAYLELMSEWCARYKVQIWAYCPIPNPVHLIAVSETKEGLNLAIGEAHRRYSRRINFRQGWRGQLWHGRFSSFILGQNHLLACVRYSEIALFRKHERTGRPIGDDAFIERLDRLLDRELKPNKPGPKAIDK